MRELTKIRDAVVSALREAGLEALSAYPADRARSYAGAVAAVEVGTAESQAVGLTGYLGQTLDPTDGSVREVYGKRLEGVISADIRAERAADCETGCETATEVLLGGLPAGIRPGELQWEAIRWERETGMFLRRCRLRCRAFFVASRQEDGPEFLDFQLKGVLNREQSGL